VTSPTLGAYLTDWAILLISWVHLIAAMIWVGTSFYFVWLDNNLVPTDQEALRERGVSGELWALQGGAFYNVQKYPLGPRRGAVSHLHWLFHESYLAWLSGLALLVLMFGPGRSSELVPGMGLWGLIPALGFMASGWLVYDLFCIVFCQRRDGHSPDTGNERRCIIWLLVLALPLGVWSAFQLFTAKAAFLVIGGMLATIMTGNVLLRILPGQRDVVSRIQLGRTPVPQPGQRAKRRSLHNSYLILPVLVTMTARHSDSLSHHPASWVMLLMLLACALGVRHMTVVRQRGRMLWELVPLILGLLTAVILLTAPT
jgi:uncharacterized membrane protein